VHSAPFSLGNSRPACTYYRFLLSAKPFEGHCSTTVLCRLRSLWYDMVSSVACRGGYPRSRVIATPRHDQYNNTNQPIHNCSAVVSCSRKKKDSVMRNNATFQCSTLLGLDVMAKKIPWGAWQMPDVILIRVGLEPTPLT
jgi:hypothetical protein